MVYGGKTDIQSAFRLAHLKRKCWKWLIMKAQDPNGKWVFFVDKCLPFGTSISCSIFQQFSNALKFLIEYRISRLGICGGMDMTDTTTNYLDDFLFLALSILQCNQQIREFLSLCDQLGVLIASDKMVWASEFIVFLGILLDGHSFILRILMEKRMKAVKMIHNILDRKKSKATVKELQELCGYLNFLCKAIFPGRTFLRRMYAKYSNIVHFPGVSHEHYELGGFKLKPYHHVKVDSKFKADCRIWVQFLKEGYINDIVNQPMMMS